MHAIRQLASQCLNFFRFPSHVSDLFRGCAHGGHDHGHDLRNPHAYAHASDGRPVLAHGHENICHRVDADWLIPSYCEYAERTLIPSGLFAVYSHSFLRPSVDGYRCADVFCWFRDSGSIN